jgi:putative hydrolase of the HAD superfamily
VSGARAVVFDLWDTLVRFDPVKSREFSDFVAMRLGRDPDEFEPVWTEGRPVRDTGPMADYLRALEAPDEAIEDVLASRRDWARSALVPDPGVVDTLVELRRRGLRLGLLSVCSDDVPAVWADTQLHGLFDAEVFSCDVGLRKPDPRIYALTCDRLGVDAEDAIFVGDGANDELAGAERAGLRSVLICPNGREPFWPEAREWSGARISTIPEILDYV